MTISRSGLRHWAALVGSALALSVVPPLASSDDTATRASTTVKAVDDLQATYGKIL